MTRLPLSRRSLCLAAVLVLIALAAVANETYWAYQGFMVDQRVQSELVSASRTPAGIAASTKAVALERTSALESEQGARQTVRVILVASTLVAIAVAYLPSYLRSS